MTYLPFSADRAARKQVQAEGVITRMVRLWVEHYQRMIDLGVRPY